MFKISKRQLNMNVKFVIKQHLKKNGVTYFIL